MASFLYSFARHGRFRHCVGPTIISTRSGIGGPLPEAPMAEVCVSMRPSVFLEIAPPLEWHEIDWLLDHMRSGGAIHPPMLHLDPWPDEVGDGYPETVAHDGRHRMTCLLALGIDLPVPVLLRGAPTDMGSEMIQRMRTAVWCQRHADRAHFLVKGPIFEEMARPGEVLDGIGLDELYAFIRSHR